MTTNQRLIMFLIVLFSLIFIVNLSRSIYSIWQKGEIVVEREAIKDRLAQDNEQLRQKASQVQSPEFIEKEAREKLNLQKEGEIVIVLPKDVTQSVPTSSVMPLPTWKQWYQLFF